MGDEATVIFHGIWNPGTEYESTNDVTLTLQRLDGTWRITAIACAQPEPLVSPEPSAGISVAPPEQTVEAFYDWYLAASAYDEASQTRQSPLSTGAYRSSEYLTEAFIQEVDQIIASFEQGGYDPFLCAQDVPESFTVGPAQGTADTASLFVRTSFEGHRFTVDLRLVDGVWKIDGVTCEGAQLEGVSSSDEPQVATREGWQVFYDTTYGYRIDYPADWTTIELELTMPELEAPVVRIVQFLP